MLQQHMLCLTQCWHLSRPEQPAAYSPSLSSSSKQFHLPKQPPNIFPPSSPPEQALPSAAPGKPNFLGSGSVIGRAESLGLLLENVSTAQRG